MSAEPGSGILAVECGLPSLAAPVGRARQGNSRERGRVRASPNSISALARQAFSKLAENEVRPA
jgi:hypothetical protein